MPRTLILVVLTILGLMAFVTLSSAGNFQTTPDWEENDFKIIGNCDCKTSTAYDPNFRPTDKTVLPKTINGESLTSILYRKVESDDFTELLIFEAPDSITFSPDSFTEVLSTNLEKSTMFSCSTNSLAIVDVDVQVKGAFKKILEALKGVHKSQKCKAGIVCRVRGIQIDGNLLENMYCLVGARPRKSDPDTHRLIYGDTVRIRAAPPGRMKKKKFGGSAV